MRGYMSHHTHYFWAVKLPDDIKQKIYNELNNVQSIFQFQRWVHRDDYHITLAFLGGADEGRLQTAIDLVTKAMTEEKSFPLQIVGLNIFGNNKAPRIFWGAVNEEELRSMPKGYMLIHLAKKMGILKNKKEKNENK